MSVEERLYSLINYEKGFAKYQSENYTPGKVGKLLKNLNIPFENLRFVHIAGTKGKGSTAHYIAELLNFGLKRVGLFTSPHLFRVNERISINGTSISDQDLDKLLNLYEKQIRKADLTFFDALTFLATVYFQEQQCDWVVFETGLGGRLDSTNFITPRLSILTPISKDHTLLLGNTISEIASEKAGIIKPNIPILCSAQEKSVLKVIQKKAAKTFSTCVLSEKQSLHKILRFSPKGTIFQMTLHWQEKHISFSSVELKQIGKIFVNNFVLASLAILMIGEQLTPFIINQSAKLQITGRMQLVENTLLDVSHNESSLTQLFQTLQDYFEHHDFNLMIGILADKEIDDITQLIRKNADLFKQITIFDFEHPRKSGGKTLYNRLQTLKNCTYAPNLNSLSPSPSYLNVLTGSFYTIKPYITHFLPNAHLP